ncbi:hypothetical protein AB0L82_01345 [Nocardia sp. NPDC052001]|uniref:hypothetical protein n=1 Tax=Nocardia sp. NPDC052001 TaxID=3154853 RepID=UPI00343B030A
MIGKFESNKDLIQELTSSGARHVGNIASIITGTVAEVTKEIGDWITDAIEMREAAAAAAQDAASQRASAADLEDFDDDFDGDVEPVAAQTDSPKAQPGAVKVEPEPEFIDAEIVEPRQ